MFLEGNHRKFPSLAGDSPQLCSIILPFRANLMIQSKYAESKPFKALLFLIKPGANCSLALQPSFLRSVNYFVSGDNLPRTRPHKPNSIEALLLPQVYLRASIGY
jgi:hypothetical protein